MPSREHGTAPSQNWLESHRELLIQRHDDVIGRSIEEIETPALLLDLDVAIVNAKQMAEFLSSGPVRLRPHVKVHKSPDAARIQMDLGAIGVATATVAEAALMFGSGVQDVLVANQVVGASKIEAAAELALEARLTVAVDDPANIRTLGHAAARWGSSIGVLIEYDIGMGRSGARTLEELKRLMEDVLRERSLQFRGLMGYEGHCTGIANRQERAAEAEAAMSRLAEAVTVAEAEGGVCEVVSGGGTGTYFASGVVPPLTELQAGSYMVMDGFHAELVPEFAQALFVLGSVISRHGTVAILDSGRKAVSTDLKPPNVLRDRTRIAFIHEEHMGLTVDRADQLRVGDRVLLRPGYGPMTVNLYDVYHVIQVDVVTEIWPILTRHPPGCHVELA